MDNQQLLQERSGPSLSNEFRFEGSDPREFDRRDSPRREVAFDVIEPGQKPRSCVGDLSIGGVSFRSKVAPSGTLVDLTFSVPTLDAPICATAEVMKCEQVGANTIVHAVFAHISVEAELAIARWFDDTMLNAREQTVVSDEASATRS